MGTNAPITLGEITERARRLGFGEPDLVDLRLAGPELLADANRRTAILECADRLRAGIGRLTADGPDPWASMPDRADGLVPMVSLLVAAPEVVDYQCGRGVSEGQAWRNLSDLGQQVWVHRLAYGRFGLHTHGWLRIVWAGGFAWLGRLQFNLQQLQSSAEWVLSTHIPRRGAGDDDPGPLSPDAVQESFVRAADFYAGHFPDVPTSDFQCRSWLLAPELADALPGSNIAAFQQLWLLDEEIGDGDNDAVYFTFARQPPCELGALPRTSRLERAVVDRLAGGAHWPLRTGRIRQADVSGFPAR